MIEFDEKKGNLEGIVRRAGNHADVASLSIAATIINPYFAVAALIFLYIYSNKEHSVKIGYNKKLMQESI